MSVDALVKKVLEEIGIKPERYDLQWASAAEAPRFVRLITDFTRRIKELGPLGEAEGLSPDEVKLRIDKAIQLVSDRKLRMSLGNVTKSLRKDGDFSEEHIGKVIDEKMSKTISGALAGGDETKAASASN
jgi:F420-non-reducing hydrogenase iron-sulfur subunit